MPNFYEKTVWQSYSQQVGKSVAGYLPNIYGSTGYEIGSPVLPISGAFSTSSQTFENGRVFAQIWTFACTFFDAQNCSEVYTPGQTYVVPASNMILFCIKY